MGSFLENIHIVRMIKLYSNIHTFMINGNKTLKYVKSIQMFVLMLVWKTAMF
jgi:hypothetical protein